MNYISEKQNELLIARADLLIEELRIFPDEHKIRILEWRVGLLEEMLQEWFRLSRNR